MKILRLETIIIAGYKLKETVVLGAVKIKQKLFRPSNLGQGWAEFHENPQ